MSVPFGTNLPTSHELSTLELLTLPIAPGFVTIARKVTQGYFLSFSNLGGAPVRLRLLIAISSWTALNACDAWEDRELTLSGTPGDPQVDPTGIGNHQSILDITGGTAENFCQTSFGELEYLGSINAGASKLFLTEEYELGGGATGLWTLLPNLDGSPTGPNLVAKGKFEVRGWSSIGICESAQPETRLLVTPELRGTYYPASLQTAADPVDVSQISQVAAGLPVAGGSGRLVLQAASYQSNGLKPAVRQWAIANGLTLAQLAPFADELNFLIS